MEKLKILRAQQSVDLYAEMLGQRKTAEVAVVRNLDYIESPFEFYPLAKKTVLPLKKIDAVAVDMDGTSTTTEPLALKALEYMTRRITGRMSKKEWAGLSKKDDYPHIIGNSNFYHVEFLLRQYRDSLNKEEIARGFLEALLWTGCNSRDQQRKKEVLQNAVNVGLGGVLQDSEYIETISAPADTWTIENTANSLYEKYGRQFCTDVFSAMASAALDIYYANYHGMLQKIAEGGTEELALELYGERTAVLIGPMPGFSIYLMLIKGWLGEEAHALYPLLHKLSQKRGEKTLDDEALKEEEKRFIRLARYFEAHPVKLSLATASIFYEADTVMKEVFRVIQREIASYPLSAQLKSFLHRKFSSYRNVFDAFVTATDSNEARLKPHRDIYSMSLYQMSVPRERYQSCIAFEDTQPGIVSARAAGYGVTVAMPNKDTDMQNYDCAGVIARGGLPEVMLKYHHFLEVP